MHGPRQVPGRISGPAALDAAGPEIRPGTGGLPDFFGGYFFVEFDADGLDEPAERV